MQEQREVGRDLRVELRDILVRMGVVVVAAVNATVFPDEVVFRLGVDYVYLRTSVSQVPNRHAIDPPCAGQYLNSKESVNQA